MLLLYVVGDYPIRSESFIRREIAGMESLGWSISVWSVKAGKICYASAPPSPLDSQAAEAFESDTQHPARSAWSNIKCDTSWLAERLGHPRVLLSALRRWRQLDGISAAAQRAGRIHAHFAEITVDLAAGAARRTSLPFTCSVHAADVFTASPRRLRMRLRPAAAVIACTQAAEDAVLASGIAPDRVHVVRHGLPIEVFDWYNEPNTPRIDPSAPPRILAVGRLVAKKGFDLLLDAAARLRTLPVRQPEWILVGDGPLRNKLEKQAAELGLSEVCFTGAIDESGVRDWLRRASLLVLPSRRMPNGDRDGLANVLLEAMASGVPIVTTTAGSAAEVVTDGVHARLVPPEAPQALAAAIAEVIEHPEAAILRATAARRLIETRFSLPQALAPLDRLFRSELAGQGTSRSRARHSRCRRPPCLQAHD